MKSTYSSAIAGLIILMACAGHVPSCTCSCAQRVDAEAGQVADRLYFGRSIPGGGVVSTDDWARFLAEVATPRFPNGFTVWPAEGQWRDSETGDVVREPSFVLEVLHPDTPADHEAIMAIADEYKRRFRQQAVLCTHDILSLQLR